MRRSIDDHQIGEDELPPGVDDVAPISWAVAVCDDYDDAIPRIVLTIEEIGRPGAGLIGHFDGSSARRLRAALRDALREVGEEVGP
ncbi:MAG: hypothetical protein B7C54_01905 [Acidimicrobiales bacterium mtb01]|nr:hypothetical protein [Actinomycetota bacterium]TEX47842.1 MAG: hypothetical protein B7C54_01905 [Acidimicrobiales bacterium mtb01]